MEVSHAEISEVLILRPVRHTDDRGFFTELFTHRNFQEATGLDIAFVQDNLSLSTHTGTIRGIHFQSPPIAQTKLVMVLAGAIIDVVVDIRMDSPTYGHHVTIPVSAAEATQVLVPEGFAHGFCVLEPDTLVMYKVNNYYSESHDHGILWNDPDLGISWPVEVKNAIVSEMDRAQPRLADIQPVFNYKNS